MALNGSGQKLSCPGETACGPAPKRKRRTLCFYFGYAGLIDAANGTPWFGDAAPQGYDGDQYAFVQMTGSVSQSFNSGAGLFRVSWLEASRPAFCCAGNQTYKVTLDNVSLGSFSTTSGQQF